MKNADWPDTIQEQVREFLDLFAGLENLVDLEEEPLQATVKKTQCKVIPFPGRKKR